MVGATSKTTITPLAEGILRVPTIKEGVPIEIKCYYSPEFTSTLLSDIDILESSKLRKEYCGQSMVKFFDPEELFKKV